jgi:hypothetical protein
VLTSSQTAAMAAVVRLCLSRRRVKRINLRRCSDCWEGADWTTRPAAVAAAGAATTPDTADDPDQRL